IRQLLRVGPRQRPLSNTTALVLLYGNLVLAIVVVWRLSADGITHWVQVTAPAAVEQLFSSARAEPIERLIAGAPVSPPFRAGIKMRVDAALDYVERKVRRTLEEIIASAPYAVWLAA